MTRGARDGVEKKFALRLDDAAADLSAILQQRPTCVIRT
jgi:hypothetical protein